MHCAVPLHGFSAGDLALPAKQSMDLVTLLPPPPEKDVMERLLVTRLLGPSPEHGTCNGQGYCRFVGCHSNDFETNEQDNKDGNDAQESELSYITKKNRIALHQR